MAQPFQVMCTVRRTEHESAVTCEILSMWGRSFSSRHLAYISYRTIRQCSHKREGQYVQRARSGLNVTLASVPSSCERFQRGLGADLTGKHEVTALYLFAFHKTNGDCEFRHLMWYVLFFSRFYHLLLAFSNKRWPFLHSRPTTWCWPFFWRWRVRAEGAPLIPLL